MDEMDRKPIPDAPHVKPPKCPKCGATMVKRYSQKRQSRFWGCSRYPHCYGGRDYVLTEEQKKPRCGESFGPTAPFVLPDKPTCVMTYTVVNPGSGPALADCPF